MTLLPGWLPPVVAAAVLLTLLVIFIVQLRRLFHPEGDSAERPTNGISLAFGPAMWTTAAFILLACAALGFFLGISTRQGWATGDTLASVTKLARTLFFATVTIAMLRLYVRESRGERRPPRVETHWGGLGGGLGGWTVSRSLIYLMAAMLFGALTALTSSVSSDAPSSAQTARADKPQAQATGVSGGASPPAAPASK